MNDGLRSVHLSVGVEAPARAFTTYDSPSPYDVYGELQWLLTEARESEPDQLLAGLSQAFSKLAQINDFPGIVRLFDRFAHLLPPLDDLPDKGPAFNLLAKGANAKLRCGDLDSAIRILEAVITRWPAKVEPRCLMANLVRHSDPERATAYLAEVRELPAFTSNRMAVLIYLDILVEAGRLDLARTEVGALQTQESTLDTLLILANLERDPRRRIGLFNDFLAGQMIAPLRLRADADSFTIDNLIAEPLPRSDDGPVISVLMTTFNSAQYVGASVASIRAQSYRNWELWIVDDCSNDGTQALLADISRQDDRIHILHRQENAGTYVAKNLALARCGGEFVICHDSDDFAHPERLERQMQDLLDNPGHVANFSRWVRMDNAGRFVLKSWGLFVHDNPASLLFRRKQILDEVGFFDSARVGADTEFRQRICVRYGWKAVRNVQKPLTVGRQHEASLTRSGAAAINEFGISPLRRSYTSSWLDWHVGNLDSAGKLFRSQAIDERTFPVPPAIAPARSDEPAGDDSFRRFELRRPTLRVIRRTADVVHAVELGSDSFLASLMVNQLKIERAEGLESLVWNLFEVLPDRYSWQARCLGRDDGSIVVRGQPVHARLLLVYGAAALGHLLGKGAADFADRTIVLAGVPEEAEQARTLLASSGRRAAVRVVNHRLLGDGGAHGTALDDGRSWRSTLYPGLFDEADAIPPSRLQRVGLSCFGRRVTPKDLAFIARLREATGLPLTLLVLEEDHAQVAGLDQVEACVVRPSTNFWSHFYDSTSLLVETAMAPSQAHLLEAAGQALMRSRLVASLSGGQAEAPGFRLFPDEAALFGFLGRMAGDDEAFRQAQLEACAAVSRSFGMGFHSERLQYFFNNEPVEAHNAPASTGQQQRPQGLEKKARRSLFGKLTARLKART